MTGQRRKMARSVSVIFLAALVGACSASVRGTTNVTETRKPLEDCIDSVDHLSVDQQQAMRDGKPFVGMKRSRSHVTHTLRP